MTNVVFLDKEAHRDLRVQSGTSNEFPDDQRFVQVVVNEFPLLVVHHPILLTKDSDTGAFICGAVFGFDAAENLFRDEPDAYRPLNLRRIPFFVAGGGDLAIDLDNPRVGTQKGQRLFDDGGAPTAYLQGVIAALGELRPGAEMTKIFIDTLLKLKLIGPIDISLRFDDGETRNLLGLYTIDPDALRELPDATVVELFRRGYLNLIYLMMASLKQVPVLAQKKNRLLLGASDALARP
ncbi:MAG: SapC family protein [Rhizomicrobium sp.]